MPIYPFKMTKSNQQENLLSHLRATRSKGCQPKKYGSETKGKKEKWEVTITKQWSGCAQQHVPSAPPFRSVKKGTYTISKLL